ncbi:flavodoxin family protein [Clostridium beijerinckii]|uniref:flavodoxin family protein n=1 Tax=Clostridium beijerinckii TaxID=1520 RepID=UPI00156FB046|nr:flavodoxin family protein [Clostridium beijerinckii]NRT74873.1 multimeric flavodoxin WrbA [Clostridium beijerinckii]
MKRIFVYIGSQKGENSNTVHFAEEILKKVAEESTEEIKYEIFTPKNANIKSCKGCSRCFVKASCNQDNTDCMNVLKKKMIESDFIIFGSPVYVHHISSDMKVFIDRISCWLHLMRLAGKPGVVLSTASSNGSDFVLNYLYKIMTYLGIKVVGRFNAFVDMPKQLSSEEFLKSNISEYAKVICDYISGNKEVETDEILEAVYKSLKNVMIFKKGSDSMEYTYWEQNNMLECESFSEVIKAKLAKNVEIYL